MYEFIDYAIRLPSDLDEDLVTELFKYEEKMNMRYITSAERIGIKQGIEQGIERGIKQNAQKMFLLALQKRFSSISKNVMERVQKANSQEIGVWFEKILDGTFEIAELE